MRTVKLIAGSFGIENDVDGSPCIVAKRNDCGTIYYGPYELMDPGYYSVEFKVGLVGTDSVLGDPVVLTLDVVTNKGQSHIVEERILFSAFGTNLGSYTLYFQLYEPRELEYRVHSTGAVAITVCGDVVLNKISEPHKIAMLEGPLDRIVANEREFLDGYLRNITGIIHVGGNLGQERRYYWLLGLNVVWVEPIQEIYQRLVDNIAGYPRQKPVHALLSDEDGREFEFQIANHGAGSSSILPMEEHAELWPEIKYVETRKLTSITLQTMIERENISFDKYQGLTLDVEGAELLVLKGGKNLLKNFKYIKCEVADFPARTGSPTVKDLDDLLSGEGFSQIIRRPFATGPRGEGTYWDIVWKNVLAGDVIKHPDIRVPTVSHPMDVSGLEKCE